MNYCYKQICPVLLALFAFGCSSGHDEVPDPEPVPVRIPITLNCGINSAVRATDSGFEKGDRIGLYVVNYDNGTAGTLQPTGNHADNTAFTYDGTWTPDVPLYWKDETTPADFYCYYPYLNAPADIAACPFETKADQSSEANYKASDFLWGKAARVAPTENAVGITLNHLFSCAIVKVAAGNGFTDEGLAQSAISVKLNRASCQASINLADGAVKAGSDAGGISFLRGTNNEFKALVVPQTLPEAADFITVNIDGNDFNLKKGFTFVSGKRHIFTITVRKTGSGINVDIGQWEDDGTDNGGVAE